MSALETLLAIPTVADDRELAVVLTFGEVWRQSQQPDRVAALERFVAGDDPEHYIGIAAARIAAYRIRLSEERLQAEALAEAMADSMQSTRSDRHHRSSWT